MLRPSVFAVLRLTTNSNLSGACTGKSTRFLECKKACPLHLQ
jgi:hypothetical protein